MQHAYPKHTQKGRYTSQRVTAWASVSHAGERGNISLLKLNQEDKMRLSTVPKHGNSYYQDHCLQFKIGLHRWKRRSKTSSQFLVQHLAPRQLSRKGPFVQSVPPLTLMQETTLRFGKVLFPGARALVNTHLCLHRFWNASQTLPLLC